MMIRHAFVRATLKVVKSESSLKERKVVKTGISCKERRKSDGTSYLELK